MADQDFNITIRTIADTTGIRLTEQGLNSIKVAALQGNQQAIAALRQLSAASKEASSSIGVGSAVGIGTMLSVMGMTIRRVQEFNAEQDKILEKMMEVTRRNYELAQSILATQDAAIEAKRMGLEPLGQQYIELQQKLIRLKTEQNSLNLPNQSKEWEEHEKQISAVGNQIEKVQSQLKAKGITDVTPEIPFPKAKKGESQALVDEIERNRRASEEALKEDVWEFDPETGGMRRTGAKQFPAFQPTPPTPGNQYPSPIGPPIPQGGIGDLTVELLTEAFSAAMSQFWSR